MRVTVYLPDDLRERAAATGLNLSALLRRAVEAELRGEHQRPTLEIERKGGSLELRIRLGLDEIRRLAR